MRRVLMATRSPGKLREMRALLSQVPGLDLVAPMDLDLLPLPEEEHIEVWSTFEENALAKARYFQARTGLSVVADDSGLLVDALGGLPGVRSKRFAPSGGHAEEEGLHLPVGEDRTMSDEHRVSARNMAYLLSRLDGVPDAERGACFVCVAVFLPVGEGEPVVARGEVKGRILPAVRGHGGFGYDPVFLDEALGRTFAELTPEEKADRSHRGRAFARLAERIISAGGGGRDA